MADKVSGGGFKVPLRFQHEGSRTVGQVPHYLDGAPHEYVSKLSLINDDTDQGTMLYGVSSDCLESPVITIGNGTGLTPYCLTSQSANAPTAPGLQATLGGVYRIQSSGTADNDTADLRLGNGGATNNGPFKYSTTKDMWFATRIALQATNTGECLVGLVTANYNATPATLPVDGLFFSKTDTGTDFTFNARKASTSTSVSNVLAAASVTLTADTFFELAFNVRSGSVRVYVNGKSVGTVAAGDANLPATTTALALIFRVATSAAATKYMDIDHFLCAAER